MSDRIILGPDGRKYITNEPLLHEDKQAEALRLADALGIVSVGGPLTVTMHEAAAELRRLHALNAELVEALHQIRAHTLYSPTGAVHLIASAALAKVETSK